MLTALGNWGFSLVGTAVLAREVGRRLPSADYRALGACSVLGICTVWAQGLSSSPALQMARASSMPRRLYTIAGEIPLTETIFRWESLVAILVEIVVVGGVMWLFAPGDGRGRSAATSASIWDRPSHRRFGRPAHPGEWLEHSPMLLLPIVASVSSISALSIAARATSVADALNALDFNNINLLLLMLGALFHWTPARLMRAFRDATPATWGMLLQFPFYAGIFGIITGTGCVRRHGRVLRPHVHAGGVSGARSSPTPRRSACSCRRAAPSG